MAPARRPKLDWGRLWPGALVSVLLAAVFSVDVLRTFSSRLWGDPGDAWQNWWNGWWFGESLRRGVPLMQTDLLFHPDGVNLWIHAMAWVNSGFTALGQALLPGFAGLNAVMFGHLAFGVFGGFVLCRALLEELEDPRLRFVAALAGGATFGLSPYVWGHIAGHLHLTSIGFVALFAHALLMSARHPGWRWPVLSGLWALLTVGCGWYLLVDELFLGLGFLVVAGLRLRQDGLAPVKRLALAAVVTGLFVLPLALPTMGAMAEPLEGGHDPNIFSADLLSLFVPGQMQWWGQGFAGTTRRFTGNFAENTGYLGYVALALLSLALVRRRRPGLLAVAIAGVVGVLASFGPTFHYGGEHTGVPGPYRLLEAALPILQGMGCPVRFALVMNLALGAGVALGAVALAHILSRLRVPAWLPPLVCGALVLVEYAPSHHLTSRYPSPAWLSDLKDDPRPGAIADLTGWAHPLYNQTLHGRPILHGYLARRPEALVQKLYGDPVLGPIYRQILDWGRGVRTSVAFQRVDAAVDFDWGVGAPDPRVDREFSVVWTGTLLIPTTGDYTFVLGADDSARLHLGRQVAVNNPGPHAYQETRGTVRLEAGPVPLRLVFSDVGAAARVRLAWIPPGGALSVVPSSVLNTPDGQPGLRGVYRHRTPTFEGTAEAARAHLREDWGVRWFLVYDHNAPWVVREGLGLRRVAGSEGLSLYEVP